MAQFAEIEELVVRLKIDSDNQWTAQYGVGRAVLPLG